MNRYRVTVTHPVLGTMDRIVVASSPAPAVEAVLTRVLRDMGTFERALLEGPILVAIVVADLPPGEVAS